MLRRPDDKDWRTCWKSTRNTILTGILCGIDKKSRSANGDVPPGAVGAQEMERLDAEYKTLTEKLRPLVWEYGFLK